MTIEVLGPSLTIGNTTHDAKTVCMPDLNLKKAVLYDNTVTEATNLTVGSLKGRTYGPYTRYSWTDRDPIVNLTGLEYATNLTNLHLDNNQISDLSPLANLTNLTYINLSDNQITSIEPLANLTNLQFLNIAKN